MFVAVSLALNIAWVPLLDVFTQAVNEPEVSILLKLADDVDYSNNEFSLELPVTKVNITFKLLTGKDEDDIANSLKSLKKIGQSAEITTRLKKIITSVNGDDSPSTVATFVENILSKESLFLRDEVARINPDIELTQDVEVDGETVSLAIPMTVEFFWPKAGK